MSSRAVTVGRSLGSSERSSSVPTPDATRREDHVVDLVISDLVRSGRSVTLLDRPDRNAERTDGLTVDAELLVDGQRWAMDVTTLRWRSGLEGAVEKLKVRLKREFGADLDATGRTLVMTLPRLRRRGRHPLARRARKERSYVRSEPGAQR